jgi:cell division protein FtsL
MSLIRRPGVLMSTLLILLMGAAFVTQVVPYRQIIESRRQVAAAEAQLADLKSDNAKLEADVEALQTPNEIEKLAREKLGYVRPGEKAYVVLDPPGFDETEPESPAPTEPVEAKTWVDHLWEFVSGADLG